jgi:alkylated DNA repair dioxygenase AlkB
VTGSENGEPPLQRSARFDTMGLRVDTQLHLFAGSGQEIPQRRRIVLDDTSWVELVGGWLDDGAELFAHLLANAPWEQRHRRLYEQVVLEPRLTAEVRDLRGADPRLIEAADRLSREYGVRYDNLWMNLYRDHRDSTAWHRDRFSCRRDECIVPVLTLGTPRRFLLKPHDGGRSIGFRPGPGDLIVMGGRCQRDWVHSVPKANEAAGPRISINFQSSEQARARERPTPRP